MPMAMVSTYLCVWFQDEPAEYCDRSCEEVDDGGKLAGTRLLWDEFAQVVNLLKVNLLFSDHSLAETWLF